MKVRKEVDSDEKRNGEELGGMEGGIKKISELDLSEFHYPIIMSLYIHYSLYSLGINFSVLFLSFINSVQFVYFP